MVVWEGMREGGREGRQEAERASLCQRKQCALLSGLLCTKDNSRGAAAACRLRHWAHQGGGHVHYLCEY